MRLRAHPQESQAVLAGIGGVTFGCGGALLGMLPGVGALANLGLIAASLGVRGGVARGIAGAAGLLGASANLLACLTGSEVATAASAVLGALSLGVSFAGFVVS